MSSSLSQHIDPIIIAGGGPTGIFTLIECDKRGLYAELFEASSILGGAPAIGGDCLANRPVGWNWGDDYMQSVRGFWEAYNPSIDVNTHYACRYEMFNKMLSSFIPSDIMDKQTYTNSPVHGARLADGCLVVDVKGVEKNASKLVLATGHQWNTPVHEAFEEVLGDQYYASPWLTSDELKNLNRESRVLLLGGANGAVDFAQRVQDLERNDLTLTMVTADGAGFRPLTMDMIDANMELVSDALDHAETSSDVMTIFDKARAGEYATGQEKNINPFIVEFSKTISDRCADSLKGLSDRFIKMAGRIIGPDLMSSMELMGCDHRLQQVFGYVAPNDVRLSSGKQILVSGLSQELPKNYIATLDSLSPKIFNIDGRDEPFDYIVNTSPFVRGVLLDKEKKLCHPLLRNAFDNGLVIVTDQGHLQATDSRVVIANASLDRSALFSVARSIEMATRLVKAF